MDSPWWCFSSSIGNCFCGIFWQNFAGTIHLRRLTIFDPYPPTISIPAKCLWRRFSILMYCDLSTIGTWRHTSPLRHADVLNGWFLTITPYLSTLDFLKSLLLEIDFWTWFELFFKKSSSKETKNQVHKSISWNRDLKKSRTDR